MAGTKEGGRKTAIKIKQLYGEDYYSKLGSKGGSVKHPKTRGFYLHPDLASKAGKKGGYNSKRKKAKLIDYGEVTIELGDK